MYTRNEDQAIQDPNSNSPHLWMRNMQSEKTIGIFERKILRRIFGTVKEEGQQGTLRTIQGCRPCNLH
jgi:hypothetical protein